MTQQLGWQPTSFPPNFQNSVVKLLCRDPKFCGSVKPVLPLEFFDQREQGSEFFGKAVELIYNYMNEARTTAPPTQTIFDVLSSNFVSRLDPGWQPKYFEAFRYYSWQFWQEPFYANEIEFVREQTFSWVRRRAEMSLMVEAKMAIDKGESIESVNFARRLNKISQIGHTGDQQGLILFQDDLQTWNTIFTPEVRATVKTGKKHLDNFMGGGLGLMELTVIGAPPNTGKTTVMCDLIGGAILQGEPVVYITCEQSQLLIMQKIISGITQIPPHRWLEGNNPAVIWQWIQYLRNSGSRIAIKQFASGRATTSEIEAYILSVAEQFGKMPRIVAVDYADLLAATRGKRDRRFELAEIYTDLRAIAVDLNLAMLTATQTNRDSMGKDRINLENLAECFDKAAIADIIMFLCQTEEEQRDDRARLFFGKNRNRKKYVEVPFKLNYELARLEEDERAMGWDRANAQAQQTMDALAHFGPAGGNRAA